MEQALVFASIIVGVAVSDQVLSLNRLLRSESPVRWHWACPAAAFLVLLTNVQVWWRVAGERQESITIGAFLPLLGILVLLALLSAASLPDRLPKEGIDLKQYYHRTKRFLWLLFALTMACLLVAGAVLNSGGAGLGAWAVNRLPDIILLGVMVGLAFARRSWVIALGLLALSLGPIGWLSQSVS
jgi:hypothetical protein